MDKAIRGVPNNKKLLSGTLSDNNLFHLFNQPGGRKGTLWGSPQPVDEVQGHGRGGHQEQQGTCEEVDIVEILLYFGSSNFLSSDVALNYPKEKYRW